MAREIKIPIASETGAFEKGIRAGVIEPLEDAEKALEELGRSRGPRDLEDNVRDAERALDDLGKNRAADEVERSLTDAGDAADDLGNSDGPKKLEADLKQAEKAAEGLKDVDLADGIESEMKAAQKATERLKDDVDDAADAIEKDFRAAYKGVGQSADDGLDKARQGMGDLKDEGVQAARETAASWDGSLEGIGDLAQEITANAFSGFGPAGVAGGIAAAAGLAVIIESFNKITEASDEARDSAFSLAYEVGGALEAAGYSARLNEWTSDTEKYKQVMDLAVATGWDEVDVIDALASGGDQLDKLNDAFGRGEKAMWLTSGRLWELEGVLDATSEGYLSGAQAADIQSRALGNYAQKVGTATGETDELGNAIYRLPDNTEVVIDAKTGRASENIYHFHNQVNQVPTSKNVDAYFQPHTGQFWSQWNALPREKTIDVIMRQGRQRVI